MPTFGSGGTDNQALRDIRDIMKSSHEILKESQKQTKYMFWISVLVGFIILLQLIFLIYQVTLT